MMDKQTREWTDRMQARITASLKAEGYTPGDVANMKPEDFHRRILQATEEEHELCKELLERRTERSRKAIKHLGYEVWLAHRPPVNEWEPASNGAETPFLTRTGRRLQYVWNRESGEHAYLDLDRDVILTAEEASEAMDLG